MEQKHDFIGKYLDRKMKGHGLPYGIGYFQLLADTEDAAERAWERKQRKLKTPTTNAK